MTTSLFNTASEFFATAQLDWLSVPIKVVLTSTDYTFNAVDAYLSDIPAENRVYTTAELTNKSATDGYLLADNILVDAVPIGSILAAVFYWDTGNESTSLLIAYTDEAAGLPFTGDGGRVFLLPNGSPARFLKL